MKKLLAFAILGAFLVSCFPTPPPEVHTADFQPPEGFAINAESSIDELVPVDLNIYSLSGEVIGPVDGLVRQSAPATGSISGYGGGYAYGYYTGPTFDGVTIVRLLVEKSDLYLAPIGSAVIVKVRDTKASALLPGDHVELRCRIDNEHLPRIDVNEVFSWEEMGTPEIDKCRMSSPIILIPESVSDE